MCPDLGRQYLRSTAAASDAVEPVQQASLSDRSEWQEWVESGQLVGGNSIYEPRELPGRIGICCFR